MAFVMKILHIIPILTILSIPGQHHQQDFRRDQQVCERDPGQEVRHQGVPGPAVGLQAPQGQTGPPGRGQGGGQGCQDTPGPGQAEADGRHQGGQAQQEDGAHDEEQADG